jgi:outer membrane protein TolC
MGKVVKNTQLIFLGGILLNVFCIADIAAGGEAIAPKVLTLSAAIAQALANNPEIEVARKKTEVARAKAGQAGYLEDPEANLEAWGIPLNRPSSLRSANPIVIGVRQKLPFFGKRDLQSQVAEHEVAMAEEELRAKQIEIASRVRTAYADVFIASRSVGINNELLRLMRDITTTAESLYRAGKVPQQDVFKALLEQTDLLNRITSADRDLTAAQAKLTTLLDYAISTTVETEEPNPRSLPIEMSDLEKIAVEERPDIQGVEADIRRSEAAIALAERNGKYPDFMVGLQYWVAPDQSPKHMYTPMVSITVPFAPWTHGKHEYEIAEATAEKQMAQANLRAAKAMARSEIKQNWAKLQAAQKSISIYRDGLLPQAEQSFQSILGGYQTGGVSFAMLLDSQKTIRDVRLGYYKALVEYEQALADLERALGRRMS